MQIIRKEIYLCGGDKRHIYELPQIIDERFKDAISVMGEISEITLYETTLWIVRHERKMELRFESGTHKLDARFKRKVYKDQVAKLEDILMKFFNSTIETEY
jgi:hypothetical protein